LEHLSQVELDAFVVGATLRDEDRLRRHLSSCADCAQRLAREARLELELHEAALLGEVEPSKPLSEATPEPFRRLLLQAAIGLAIVSGVWRFASRHAARVPASQASAQVVADVDTPCHDDPMKLAPGYSVVSPRDLGKRVTPSIGDGAPL
jgi:hypothetical protein